MPNIRLKNMLIISLKQFLFPITKIQRRQSEFGQQKILFCQA